MFWKYVGIGSLIIIGGGMLSTLLGVVGTVSNVANQPGRVLTKTFDADNMINNYEWYRDQSNSFLAKVRQVNGHKDIIKVAKSEREISTLMMELAAIKQSCRDLAGKYNANASKLNRNIFMGGGPFGTVPQSLNMGDCE